VQTKNLPFSVEEVRRVCENCRDCAQVKLRFYKREAVPLIKTTKLWERLSMDFKGPLPGPRGDTKYLLVLVDGYGRFPFAFPAKTVISCLSTLFVLFGFPCYIHSERGRSFVSKEVTGYLHSRGVATSSSTPYHPTGNSQFETMNQRIWRTVQLLLKSENLPYIRWYEVLPDALHSIRSLLCTANVTPHERSFASFPRRSTLGKSLPS